MNDNEEYVDTYEGYYGEGGVLNQERWYSKPIVIGDIISKESYDKTISEVKGKKKFKLWVSPFLLEIVVDRQVSNPALGLFCFLGQSIGYNNLVYLTLKEMIDGSGYVRQTIYKALEELEGKFLIRKVGNKLSCTGDRFYYVNPLYFFHGYYPNRENAIKQWLDMGS